jgi:hypothetical protein
MKKFNINLDDWLMYTYAREKLNEYYTRIQDKYYEICAEWEKIMNLQLEHDTYQKIILGDVNNYIAVNNPKIVDVDTAMEVSLDNPHYVFNRTKEGIYSYQAVKCKGRFEFHDLALHKNKSFLVKEFDEEDWRQLLSMNYWEDQEDGKSFLRVN